MKKIVNLCCMLLLVTMLSGCNAQGLSNRAIVKAILVDIQDNEYKVSLVMLNCEPSSQIAEIKETASVYTGISSNLSTAILNAEKKQNKSAFYAQNELLYINLKAVNKFDDIVNYFSSDNFSRPGMTVYLTEATEDVLKKTEKSLPKLINGVENINVLNNPFIETRIYDVSLKNNSYSAAFPVLKINEDDGSYIVNNIGIISNNGLAASLADDKMAFSIMLLKRSDVLNISTDAFNFQANSIRISNEVINGALYCTISGRIKQYEALQNSQDLKAVETMINEYVSNKSMEVFNDYFQKDDILNFNWWFKMYNVNKDDVQFISKLVI